MASEEPAPPKTMLLFSKKSPEEAAIFGLRGSDIQDLRAEPVSGPPATPDEWGFTSPTADGICKYCQLMLHPDPPQLIEHQPNVMHLINSGDTCSTCKWLEISIQRGATSVLAEFQRGNPELCDENNFSRPVTVELTKHEKYIMAVGWVGNRQLYTNGGIPLTISSPSRLGSLATRRFWIPHDELDESEPFKRQDTLKTWLKECESHEQCIESLPDTKAAKLPRRVLDLSGSVDIPSDPNDIKIKLRETEEGETGTYTAPSYC
ncbi:tol [Fusarium subglutinans]|uniref:Tol n=1 Tax=Gibberella subglutinans TaxID=42677 RepID=A0A8H5Q624_GIBSU|nr:tol [Fusarium subglutinans]KAF5610255.1 tol [Fusarium subglutinans]